MIRPLLCASALSISSLLNLQADSITAAQQEKLPLLADQVDFIPFHPASQEESNRILGTPGTWHDVRLIAWAPPVATISGKREKLDWLETVSVDVASFPPALQAKLRAMKPQTIPLDKAAANILILKDGRRLEQVTLLYAVPYQIHISHSGGEEDVPLSKVESNYSAQHDLKPNSVWVRQLTLKDGSVLDQASIVAQNPERVRIMHNGGTLSAALADLPPEVVDLVQKHLIAKDRFAAEVLGSQAKWAREHPRTTAAQPKAEPGATPIPAPFIRTGPFAYAQLPLKSGRVLHDVRLTKINEGLVEFDGKDLVLKEELPPEVLTEVGHASMPLLTGFLQDGVVARQRSAIFSAVDGPDPKNPFDRASGGVELAHVGQGYVAKTNRWRNYDGAVVALPVKLAGREQGYVLVQDFAHLGVHRDRKWWNESETRPLPERPDVSAQQYSFRPITLDQGTVLLDPFEGKATLFDNEKNVMKRAWQPLVPGWEHHAFVETDHGYYFGVLTRRDDLAEAKMTWPELVRNQAASYMLKKSSERSLKEGQTILKISDQNGSNQATLADFQPARFQIRPGQYRRLTEQGMPGLLSLMQTPDSDGVELTGDPKLTYRSRQEVMIDRVALEYVNETASTLLTKRIQTQRERTIDLTGEGKNLRETKSPWREVKKETLQEIPKDADGGVRLTDGQKVYEILPSRISDSQLLIYEILPNSLDRKAR